MRVSEQAILLCMLGSLNGRVEVDKSRFFECRDLQALVGANISQHPEGYEFWKLVLRSVVNSRITNPRRVIRSGTVGHMQLKLLSSLNDERKERSALWIRRR